MTILRTVLNINSLNIYQEHSCWLLFVVCQKSKLISTPLDGASAAQARHTHLQLTFSLPGDVATILTQSSTDNADIRQPPQWSHSTPVILVRSAMGSVVNIP